MKGIITILFSVFAIFSNAQNRLGPIGQWRAHFDNHSVEHVVKGENYIYAASPYQVIRIDNKQNRYWIDKTNGLSDINKFKKLVEEKDPDIQVELLNFYPDKK